MKIPVVADLFCGAGGTSIGAAMTGGVKIGFAVNHWKTAIDTHKANFPNAKHVETTLRRISPGECNERINFLFASPECTHHSVARGGRPTSDQQRSGAWDVLPWIEHHRPSFLVCENVVEFENWGPVNEKTGKPYKSMRGNFFRAWVAAVESAGYRVSWRRLNSADFGAATSRQRLFVIARRGRRQFDWPEPTHEQANGTALPGFKLKKWRGVSEVLDAAPVPSVFARSRPLKDPTLQMIAKGLRKHRTPPFIVSYYGTQNNSSVDQPCPTVTCVSRHALVAKPTSETAVVARTDGERSLLAQLKSMNLDDLGFRMLSNAELARAQGFPESYRICGTSREVCRQIGNSVAPAVAKAITEVLL